MKDKIIYRKQEIKDRNIDELLGMCKGLLADDKINQDEAFFLKEWIENHFNYDDLKTYPISNIYDRLRIVLSDGFLDEEESEEIKELLKCFIGEKPINEQVLDMTSTLPLCKPFSDVIFENKIFCLTGAFTIGSRKTIENIIKELGGEVKKAPSLNTNYLVVGILGSEDWIHSSYGRKIEKAVEIRDVRKKNLRIISEEHFIKFI